MVAAFRPLSITLIATTLPGTNAKALAKLERVTAARIKALGSRMEMLPPCPHETAALAARPRWMQCRSRAGRWRVRHGRSRRRDPTGHRGRRRHGGAAGHAGGPGQSAGAGHARGPSGDRPCPAAPRAPSATASIWYWNASPPDWLLPADTIAAMGDGGLLPEAERPEPRAVASAPRRVGAVLLAAGRSSRFGAGHKLLAPWRRQAAGGACGGRHCHRRAAAANRGAGP